MQLSTTTGLSNSGIPRKFASSDLDQLLSPSVSGTCLGRAISGQANERDFVVSNPIRADEVVVCPKKVLTSVRKWNKIGVRKGLLDFIVQKVK